MTSADAEQHPPWPQGDPAAEAVENPEYPELLAAQRELLDAVASASLPADVSDRVATQLRSLTASVREHRIDEHGRQDAWRRDLRGRANPVFPPFRIERLHAGRLTASVRFPRVMLGGNGAAHGGTLPMLFDDLLGLVANHGQDGIARTAFITVNFRHITPIGVELFAEATLDRVEGRKRWTSGRLTDSSGTVLADCEGLFVQLLPGQP